MTNAELCRRLREAHPNSAQRFAGSNILIEAADAITALTERAEKAEAALREVRNLALEEAARFCDKEEAGRIANMEEAQKGSWDWGDPEKSAMAQGHKALTAAYLGRAIRALSAIGTGAEVAGLSTNHHENSNAANELGVAGSGAEDSDPAALSAIGEA